MTVGENIKRIRIQRGITQAELGHQLRISESTVRGYELGIRNPKPAKLESIAYALGVNVEVLKNSDFDNISAMHRLFQLFRQYGGSFDSNGKLTFKKMNLHPWYNQWLIYQKELEEAEKITDEEKHQIAIEDATDKFNWWMDIYPKSDSYNVDFEEQLQIRQELKHKRRTESKGSESE